MSNESVYVVLTDQIRTLEYFSSFKEESVTIPAKPWIVEILENKVPLEVLSISDLTQCIATCIYFGLPSQKFTSELLWMITEEEEKFEEWFERWNPEKKDVDSYIEVVLSPLGEGADELTWYLRESIAEPLRSELIAAWGSLFTRDEKYPSGIPVPMMLNWTRLVSLGARFLCPKCEEIVSGGNLRLLRYMHQEGRIPSFDEKDFAYEMSFAAEIAAAKGYLQILKYLHENGSPWNARTCAAATANGHLDCLKYAFENSCPWNSETCSSAARGGHLECLKYTHSNKCPWDEKTCEAAAGGNQLACLKYLYENGCPWNEETCYHAAEKGNPESLKYAFENGCPRSQDLCNITASGGTEAHLACLRYLHEKGCSWDETTCVNVVEGRNFEVSDFQVLILAYLHENDCPWDKRSCEMSAYKGNIECLKYAHENGCSWDKQTCLLAVTAGHLDCLKYAHQNGCPWDKSICSYAAAEGRLDCLSYAHENGCPWDEEVCTLAFGHGNVECLEYARENFCPEDPEVCSEENIEVYMGHLRENEEAESYDY